jgi:hypothetical protein
LQPLKRAAYKAIIPQSSSLVFLRKSHIYYTNTFGREAVPRPHQHEELGRSKKVLYTQQADKWLRLIGWSHMKLSKEGGILPSEPRTSINPVLVTFTFRSKYRRNRGPSTRTTKGSLFVRYVDPNTDRNLSSLRYLSSAPTIRGSIVLALQKVAIQFVGTG